MNNEQEITNKVIVEFVGWHNNRMHSEKQSEETQRRQEVIHCQRIAEQLEIVEHQKAKNNRDYRAEH